MSQQAQILATLKKGQKLTAMNALRLFNCFRLAARIQELRERGYDIKSTIKHVDGKRFAEYRL
jgi:biotin operon repressor